jgi:hypothetical protein
VTPVSAGLPTGPAVPDWTPPASVQERLTGVRVSVLEFDGVDRSGVDDSATGLAAAFAAGLPLVFPYGTYRSLSGLTLPATGADVLFDDAELDFSDIAAAGIALTAAGTIGSFVGCNAVAAGATAITGSAGIESGISAGDILKLKSADVFDPGRTSSTHGEQVVVASTASGQINLRSPVIGAYSTTVQFAKVTRSRLTIKGTGRITGGGSGSGHYGLRGDFLDGLRIDGPKIEFRGCETKAIELRDCLDFEIAHVDIEGSNNASNGYGVSVVNACQFGRVHHSHFRDCRHATSTNNSATNGGGIPRHISYDHNEVRDTVADAMDCHAAAEHISFEFNRIYDAGGLGIIMECPKGRIVGNQIHRPQGDKGIYLLAAAAAAPEWTVQANDIYDVTGYGIRQKGLSGAGASSPALLDILDNRMFRCTEAAVYLDGETFYRYTGARVNRNRAYACNSAGGFAAFYVAKADATEVCDNQAIQQPDAVIGTRLNDFTRGRWTGNTTSFTSAGTSKGHYGVGVTDSVVVGNITHKGTNAACEGLELDATSANNVVMGNSLRGAGTPLQLNGVTSHLTTTADGGGVYNKVA